MTSTNLQIANGLNLGLSGNYNSSSLWNTSLQLKKSWNDKIITSVDFSYNKPINFHGITWIALQSTINDAKIGNISLLGKYGTQNQIFATISYSSKFLNNLTFLLSSTYSQIKLGESANYSKIFSGGINLSYNSRFFNLSTDYFLNRDLFGKNLLSRPQLRLSIYPYQFYGGLLLASLYNIFTYDNLKSIGIGKNSYSNNTILNLSTEPFFIQKNLSLTLNLSLEQFLEKRGRNFTSSGFILNVIKNITKGISLEGFYTLQSRRKTKGWLIEGTLSQDISPIVKISHSEKLNGWMSFSFDPKYNQWRQSFADLSIEIIKNWKVQSLFNYDFLSKKINNIDLYLIREAGRFEFRFIWRSLSKQFLVELRPR